MMYLFRLKSRSFRGNRRQLQNLSLVEGKDLLLQSTVKNHFSCYLNSFKFTEDHHWKWKTEIGCHGNNCYYFKLY